MKKLLALLFALFLPCTALAEDNSTSGYVPYHGLDYDICGNYVYHIQDDGTAMILDYLSADEVLIIPNELDAFTVTAIYDGAFSNYHTYDAIRSITIPDTVTYIGISAFQGLEKLEQIIFSPDCQLKEIDNYAFAYCSSLPDVQLPSQVERIGHEAFGNCTSLTYFHIPASVTKIEVNPLTYCTSLTSITVDPENEYFTIVDNMLIDKQPREIFWDASDAVKTGLICVLSYPCGLTETQITIPEGVTEINSHAFFWCESLQNVVLPQSLLAIGSGAFYGCTSLKHIDLPAGIVHIDPNPFSVPYELRQETFTVTVAPGSYCEDWAIRNEIPYTY